VRKIMNILCWVNNTRVLEIRKENFRREQEARIEKALKTPLARIHCRMKWKGDAWDGTLQLFRNRMVFVRRGIRKTHTIELADVVKSRKTKLVVHTRSDDAREVTKYKFVKLKAKDRRILEAYLENARKEQEELRIMAQEITRIEAEERERIRQEQRKVKINCRMDREFGILHLKENEMVFVDKAGKETRISKSKINEVTMTESLKGDARKYVKFVFSEVLLWVFWFLLLVACAAAGNEAALAGPAVFWIFPTMVSSLAAAQKPMANIQVLVGTRKTFFGNTRDVFASYSIDTIDKDQRIYLAEYLKKIEKLALPK